jgi:hypothetical protein
MIIHAGTLDLLTAVVWLPSSSNCDCSFPDGYEPADYLMVFLGTQTVVAPTGAPSPDTRRTPTVIGRVTLGSTYDTVGYRDSSPRSLGRHRGESDHASLYVQTSEA